MTDSSKAPEPLKILTIDGGGLQAISTLLTLNRVLETIARENGVPENRKPRPCDVFDTIAGIGAGGWLAILLGRFRLDITACLSEWYNITHHIAPRSKTAEIRLRLLQHCYFDTDRLVERVDSLTKVYRAGDRLFEHDPQGARTRHVFVAALASDGKGYNLFRSYEIPKSAKLPEKLLEGPENPDSFTISRAFAVTGAARYFIDPWKEQMASSDLSKSSDTKFPEPHNITELALDEMWGIYGTDVPLSVVLNIGPGPPNDVDVKQIARRFPWGLDPKSSHEAMLTRRAGSSILPISQSDGAGQEAKRHSDSPHNHTAQGNSMIKPFVKGKRNRSVTRTSAFGLFKASGIDAKLKRLEGDIENDIKAKLKNLYPGDTDLYFRLTHGTAPNDTP